MGILFPLNVKVELAAGYTFVKASGQLLNMQRNERRKSDFRPEEHAGSMPVSIACEETLNE